MGSILKSTVNTSDADDNTDAPIITERDSKHEIGKIIENWIRMCQIEYLPLDIIDMLITMTYQCSFDKYDPSNRLNVRQLKKESKRPYTCECFAKNYFLLKLVFIGDAGVGKSTLLRRYCRGIVQYNWISTLGVDFETKIIHMDGKCVKLQIVSCKMCTLQLQKTDNFIKWNTNGEERYSRLSSSRMPAYYRGACGAVILYDVTNKLSFEHVRNWNKIINEKAPENVRKILIGNKTDLTDDHIVSAKEANQVAAELNIHHSFQVSAKNYKNVNDAFEAFEALTKEIFDEYNASEKRATHPFFG